MNKSAQLLPIQVVVREGVCVSNCDQYLAANEKFNLHFMKNVKVAILVDPTTQDMYSIPYSSSVKFGLIYNPSPDDTKASPYMQLKFVADVMKLKQPPLILTATTSYDGGASNKSVSEGEILFVKGVIKGGSVTKGKQLHVVNTAGEEKFLAAKCAGCFSTDPRHTKLHLCSFLPQDIQLPQFVIIYADREVVRSLPPSMSNSPVILKKVMGETSVIATCGEIGNIGAG